MPRKPRPGASEILAAKEALLERLPYGSTFYVVVGGSTAQHIWLRAYRCQQSELENITSDAAQTLGVFMDLDGDLKRDQSADAVRSIAIDLGCALFNDPDAYQGVRL